MSTFQNLSQGYYHPSPNLHNACENAVKELDSSLNRAHSSCVTSRKNTHMYMCAPFLAPRVRDENVPLWLRSVEQELPVNSGCRFKCWLRLVKGELTNEHLGNLQSTKKIKSSKGVYLHLRYT